MGNPVNLSQINLSAQQETNKFFNNYYESLFNTSSNEHDALVSFFEKTTGSMASAKILASGVLYTAKTRNIGVMDVLNEFSRLDPGQLNSALALFLNSQRYGSSYLGINTSAPISEYISRSIRF